MFHVFFFFLLQLSPSLRCSVGAGPALDVPLHVKSQMVRPGETSGDTGGGGNRKGLVSRTCFGEPSFVISFVQLGF